MPFEKGNVPWIKGRTVTDDVKKKISESLKKNKFKRYNVGGWNKGIPMTEAQKDKFGRANKGRKASKETRMKMSKAQKGKRLGKPNTWSNGKKSHWWKGGITPISFKIRSSLKYKTWRRNIFKRDDYTCQVCGKRGGTMHADHIKSFAKYPKLRFRLSNGRTLCVLCHKKTDTYPKNLLNTRVK